MRLQTKLIGLLAAVMLLVAVPSAAAGGASADLTIAPQGAGSGNVIGQGSVSGPGIIDCDWNGTVATGACSFASGGNQSIQLAATASPGSTFDGWTNCPGMVTGTGGNICTYMIDAVTDDFTIQPKFILAGGLTVTKTGTGTGTVTSVDGNINCGATCTYAYPPGTSVTLNAVAAPGSTFVQWLGVCAGTPVTQPCTVMTTAAALTATAQFDQITELSLIVTTSGSGTGSVTSSPAGIVCPTTCSATFAQGTVVTLTPSAGPNSAFVGWSGACSGTGACTVTVNAASSVDAEFVNTRVQAGVLGARFIERNDRRYARVRINAVEEIDVRIRVIRNGRTRAAKTVNDFGPGTGTILVRIGNGVAAGGARIQIVLTDQDGNTKTVNRNGRIPRR